jgi:signal transduction histidine kinase
VCPPRRGAPRRPALHRGPAPAAAAGLGAADARVRAEPPGDRRARHLPAAHVGHVRRAAGPWVDHRLLTVEHADEDRYTERDLELLSGFVEPAALAVDNARWFGRLRTVGAEEERNRIARDLHDRIGQSLAYLAFELDRIVKAGERDEDVRPALGRLREDIRTVIREVRDTLYDLRTDVSDEQGFVATLELFAGRVRDRSGLEVIVRADEQERLPLPQERELFRIAQEAIINVERHADADLVTITWQSDGTSALLEIADDGTGFPIGRAGRLDSYGLLGMRERAASIGAGLEVDSTPGHGTRVRCALPVRSPSSAPTSQADRHA